MDVRLPDGTIVQGVPDGISKADLAAKLQNNGMNVPREWLESPSRSVAQPQPQYQGVVQESLGAVAEPILRLGSSAIAKPASDVAGLSSIPLHAAGLIKTDPTAIKDRIEKAMTFEPRTQAGSSQWNPLNAVPNAIGAVLDWAGRQAKDVIMPSDDAPATLANEARRAVGRGVEEAIHQAPAIAGIRGGAAAKSAIPAKQAALDVARGEAAVKNATIKSARDAGYWTTPEHGIPAAVAGIAGKTKTEKIISAHNAVNATQRLGSEVGVPEGRALSTETFEQLKDSAGNDYRAMTKAVGPTVNLSPQFRDTLASTLGTLTAKIESNPELYGSLRPAKNLVSTFLRKTDDSSQVAGKERPAIERTLTKAAIEQPGLPISRTLESAASDMPHGFPGSPLPRATPIGQQAFFMNTNEALKSIQDLRKQASTDYVAAKLGKQGKRELADGKMAIADALEQQLEDNLSKTGNQTLVDNFRKARERFAKIYLLERITNDATGKVDLSKLASLSERPQYKGVLSGEFKTAADLAKAYSKAAQKPTGEAIPRLTVWDGLFAIGALHIGTPFGAAAGGELAVRLGVPSLANRGMLQNKIPSYKAGNAASKALPITGISASIAANERARKRRERARQQQEQQ